MKLVAISWSSLCLAGLSLAAKAPSKDAILLSTVKSLTLRSGRSTTHRRVPAMPQTSCVGGTAAGLFTPDALRCENRGADYDAESIQWTCTAALPPEFRLGATDVVCEGYRNAEDDWVLKGSCAVEYRLELTPVGEDRYPDRVNGRAWMTGGSGREGEGSPLAAFLFWCLFFGVIAWMLFAAFVRDSEWWRGRSAALRTDAAGNRRPPGGGGGGGGGGGWWPGGGGGGDDPPPPYSRHDDSPRKPSRPRQDPAGWRPGFWTGAAGGAAATYLANSMRNNSSNSSNNNMGQRRDNGGGWFGGGDPGPSSSRYPNGGGGGASSSQSYSSTRYESTGFGGTRRR